MTHVYQKVFRLLEKTNFSLFKLESLIFQTFAFRLNYILAIWFSDAYLIRTDLCSAQFLLEMKFDVGFKNLENASNWIWIKSVKWMKTCVANDERKIWESMCFNMVIVKLIRAPFYFCNMRWFLHHSKVRFMTFILIRNIFIIMIQNLQMSKVFKGQLILKCPSGVFKSSKNQRFFFQYFCPSL